MGSIVSTGGGAPAPAPSASGAPGSGDPYFNDILRTMIAQVDRTSDELEQALALYEDRRAAGMLSSPNNARDDSHFYSVVARRICGVCQNRNGKCNSKPDCFHVGVMGRMHIDAEGPGAVRMEDCDPPVSASSRKRIVLSNGRSLLITLYRRNARYGPRYTVEQEGECDEEGDADAGDSCSCGDEAQTDSTEVLRRSLRLSLLNNGSTPASGTGNTTRDGGAF